MHANYGARHYLLNAPACRVLPPQILRLQDGGAVPYDKLCICTGARPKVGR